MFRFIGVEKARRWFELESQFRPAVGREANFFVFCLARKHAAVPESAYFQSQDVLSILKQDLQGFGS